MTGFRIDPEALEGAIRKLEDARDEARRLTQSSQMAMPGELTAKDATTATARELFEARASGVDASLQGTAGEIVKKLTAKIESYRQTLEEYRQADDNATVDANQVGRA
ncbi:hypothetical protein GCM10027271_18230 [Saccharopolyspora gloriosae]|uniref:PE family protein n=1 Tax=Saccharopolyspora gloriosae TaxID=455344 RepID=A0A840NAH4_9PSEU|nr:hypothetical protein [Saccharopolyspora gloriosae]MBB5067373.1 hypothetical protein [Saccharopolyspora gloriosae]